MVDTLLIPFELPDPEPLSPVLVADIASLDIVLLGHYEVPEQTPTELAREEFESDAQATLDELAAPLIDAGASVRTRLVFGKARASAIDTAMIAEDCVAELNPAPTEGIERILVPIPDAAEFTRLPAFINVLCEEFTREITLFHVVEGTETRDRGRELLERTRDGMIERGLDPDLIDLRVADGGGHDAEIIRAASEYDAVVMYEAESGLGDRIFGSLPDRIAAETGDPVIVVRRDYEPRARDSAS